MFAIRFFQCLNKSRICKLINNSSTISNSVLNQIKRTQFGSANQFKSELNKDVVLFKNEKPHFFFLINVFSGLNCLVWTYMVSVLVRFTDNSEVSEEALESIRNAKGGGFFSKIFAAQRKYSKLLQGVSIALVMGLFAATLFYTGRSIRTLILHRGGRYVTIITYKLPWTNHELKMPLSMVSSLEARKDTSSYIPIKIKDKWFFYLIDKKGEFLHPALYDVTVGIKRNIY